jgi:hypothetical protein
MSLFAQAQAIIVITRWEHFFRQQRVLVSTLEGNVEKCESLRRTMQSRVSELNSSEAALVARRDALRCRSESDVDYHAELAICAKEAESLRLRTEVVEKQIKICSDAVRMATGHVLLMTWRLESLLEQRTR